MFSLPNRILKNARNRLLTRAARKRPSVFPVNYQAATVSEPSIRFLFQHPAKRWGAAALAILACLALYFLYFHNLSRSGLLGPDEPRYASIGREMARSGDFLTPRLWGQPWFEKPPLLYWLVAGGFRCGLHGEVAARLPVALCATAFLAFFFFLLRKEFGTRAAFFSTLVLGTSLGWLAVSHVAVTDMPLAVTFSASMLLMLPWLATRERPRPPGSAHAHPVFKEPDRCDRPLTGNRIRLSLAAALFGFAFLAKGLVPLVLALPLAWMVRRCWREWLRPVPIAVFLLVTIPWYAGMTVRFGWPFLEDFFWKHHIERFASGAWQHTQPFWFYVPVLLAGLLPWTPALVALFRRGLYNETRRRFLLAWFLWGFVFFSASTNKLPGYLLPLLPALAALIGIALAERKRATLVLTSCALFLAAVPFAAAVLPGALLRGITHTPIQFPWLAVAPVLLIAAAAWWLDRAGQRAAAAGIVALGVTIGAVWLENSVLPVLDRTVSARTLWTKVSAEQQNLCVGNVSRGFRYSLNYYSVTPLPSCSESARPLSIEPGPSESITVVPSRPH